MDETGSSVVVVAVEADAMEVESAANTAGSVASKQSSRHIRTADKYQRCKQVPAMQDMQKSAGSPGGQLSERQPAFHRISPHLSFVSVTEASFSAQRWPSDDRF